MNNFVLTLKLNQSTDMYFHSKICSQTDGQTYESNFSSEESTKNYRSEGDSQTNALNQ